MTWIITEKNVNLNWCASGSEIARRSVVIPSPQYHLVNNVEYNSSDKGFSRFAVFPIHEIYWGIGSDTSQIEAEQDESIEQLAWNDVEGIKALALKLRDEELELANAGMNDYARKLEELDNI